MSCKIFISNFQTTYYPGNTISGHVVCVFTSRESIRGVKVRLRGKEHTDWVERESYYDSSAKKTRYRNVHYSGDNKFLAAEILLDGERTMSPGEHEYPFKFTLPRNLPTTYQGSYGYIKYYLKGVVDIPFAFDYEDEKYINVYAPIDFNEISSSLTLDPCTYQDEKNICCCCCASGPITLDVHLQKEAFVLGEVAKIKIEVTNLSNESIDQMDVRLKTTLESKTTSPRTSHKYDSELLASNSDTGVGAHGQRTYEFELEIPRTAAIFNFNRSTLFKQWFVLKIEAGIPGCHSNMEIETGVDIGHIPIRNVTPTQRTFYRLTTDIPGGPFPPPPPMHVPDQPPPYPASEKAPPYPTGPPAFPAPPGPTPGQIGFTLPTNGMPPVPVNVGAPYPPGPSSSAANAPPEESAPSAPPKAKLAEEDDFILLDGASGGSSEPPPPTYSDAVTAPSYPPGAYPSGPPDNNKPSAPPK